MISKFKIRHLMVNVAPENPGGCRGHSDPHWTNCVTSATCVPCGPGSCKHDPPSTHCDSPSCKGDRDEEAEARGLDELTRSNLALLQRELRKALELER